MPNQRLSGEPVSMDTAQAIAEDFVRRVKAVQIAQNKSPWHDDAATEKQIAFLKRSGFKCEGITKKTAGDLITQVMAKKHGEPASSKQIAFLKRNGSPVSDNISKAEAQRMIGRIQSARL